MGNNLPRGTQRGYPWPGHPQLCTVTHEKPGIGLRCVDTYTLYTQVGACGLTHMGMRMVVSDAPHH